MKGYKRGLLCITTVLFLAFCFSFAMSADKEAGATAIGTVKVSGLLNVRSGPGTKYSVVKSGGTSVTLSNGAKVTITGINGKWYHIKFKQNSKTIKGYVKKNYVKVQTGSVHTKIYGLVTAKSVKIRTSASSKGAALKVSKKAVSLKKAKKVRILSETLVKNTKWYRVSFRYSSKTYKGYLPARHVALTCEKGLPGVFKSTKNVSLLKQAGKKSAVLANGKKVLLKGSKQMTVLSDTVVAGKKYLYVKFTYQKVAVKGYLLDKYITLQIVKNEASSSPAATPKPAATQKPEDGTVNMTDQQYMNKLKSDGFPSTYVSKLLALHKQYPNWKFVPYKTGLDWNTVISKESAVGLNLLSVNKSYDWKSFATGAYDWKTDKFIPFDGSTWVTASEKAVKYYMDPRNFLDARGIFQFESLEYQKASHTQAGVEAILKNTPMYNKSYTYTDDNGAKKSRKYSSTFITAASKSGVSPYHLASRAKQEVVISSTLMSSSVSGKVSGYEGIYNFYNIGAYNSTASGGAIANGLKWASTGTTYSRPWNSQYKSIVGGASYIGKNYINVGQNTLYLQKFNVTPKNRYTHQYMANVEAPNSEATKVNTAYGTQKNDMSMVFSIPVYNNMPGTACPVPSGGKNPNNYLKTLSVKNHAFTSKFVLGDDGSKVYKVTVKNSVTSINIAASAVSSSATVTGTGTKKNLKVGTTQYTVKVKSQSGSTRQYKIKVTRQAA